MATVDTPSQPRYHGTIVAFYSPTFVTILEIKNHLYNYFLTESTFSLKGDLGKVKIGKAYDEEEGDLAARKGPLLTAALEEMEKAGFLRTIETTETLYVLTQPLETRSQTVVISPYTAALAADAFNYFARQTEGIGYLANKMAITDLDLNVVIQSLFVLRDEIESLYASLGEKGSVEESDFDPSNN